ncbi:hypothetical protein SteCoe_7912 [Stentor coeruleus]|uniref:G-protein coupled receptors family 2 profile 2 domain-containing protein n=1 Tax=Stentor coeruleus TaxID=5963 RepID=A0A1R2CLG9_9CILI|nr:hypothetical protein SteCoe_7912 [Stentor coeruleus]
MNCNKQIPETDLYIVIVFCSISFCLSIIIPIICLKKNLLETYTLRIITCMSINDAICSLALILYEYFIQVINNCPFLYFFISGLMSNFIWALCIALTLRKVLIQNSDYKINHFKLWLILAYPITFTLYSIPFLSETFSYNGNMCYFSDKNYATIWLVFLFILPFTLFTIFILFILVNIYFVCRKTDKEPWKSIIIKRGYIYPLSVLVIVIPAGISFSIEYFLGRCMPDDFSAFLLIFVSSHGIMSALTLMSNEKVRRQKKFFQIDCY